MGIMSWDLEGGFSTSPRVRTPRLTVLSVYPDISSPPSEVSFRLSPSYELLTARDAHDWFLQMMREHEEFEVETDWDAQWPVPFCSATVRRVVVE